MRKTLLTIATVGLLGLSTMSGAFAQTAGDVTSAVQAAETACGPTGSPAACELAIIALKDVLALSVGVVLPAPITIAGVTLTTVTASSALSALNSFVAEVAVTPQGAGLAAQGLVNLASLTSGPTNLPPGTVVAPVSTQTPAPAVSRPPDSTPTPPAASPS